MRAETICLRRSPRGADKTFVEPPGMDQAWRAKPKRLPLVPARQLLTSSKLDLQVFQAYSQGGVMA